MILHEGVGNCLKAFALTCLAIVAGSWLGHRSCQLKQLYRTSYMSAWFLPAYWTEYSKRQEKETACFLRLLVFLKQEKGTASFLRDRKWAQHHFSHILLDKQSQCLHSRGEEIKPNS